MKLHIKKESASEIHLSSLLRSSCPVDLFAKEKTTKINIQFYINNQWLQTSKIWPQVSKREPGATLTVESPVSTVLLQPCGRRSPVRPGGARWGPVGPGGAQWSPSIPLKAGWKLRTRAASGIRPLVRSCWGIWRHSRLWVCCDPTLCGRNGQVEEKTSTRLSKNQQLLVNLLWADIGTWYRLHAD